MVLSYGSAPRRPPIRVVASSIQSKISRDSFDAPIRPLDEPLRLTAFGHVAVVVLEPRVMTGNDRRASDTNFVQFNRPRTRIGTAFELEREPFGLLPPFLCDLLFARRLLLSVP